MKQYIWGRRLAFLFLLISLTLLAGCGGQLPAVSWFGIAVSDEAAYLSANEQVIAVNLESGAELWAFPVEPERTTGPFYATPLVADDQVKVRSAMRFLLEQEPHLHIVGEAVDAGELEYMVKSCCPDLVLLDWELPGFKAEKLFPVLHGACSDLVVIALSGRPESRQVALDAGAGAFVSKGDPPGRLLAAIRDAAENGRKSDKEVY